MTGYNHEVRKFCLLLFISLMVIYFLWQSFPPNFNDLPYIWSDTFSCKAKLLQCPKTYQYCDTKFFSQIPKDLQAKVKRGLFHPNLPNFLLNSRKISCNIPDITNIRWTAIYWQESWKHEPKFLLYSAHFDRREESLIIHDSNCSQGYIRILGVFADQKPPRKYFCQMWFSETEGSSIITQSYRNDLIDYQGLLPNQLTPYMISCPLPVNKKFPNAPIAVSLIQNTSCDRPSNILQVTGSQPRKSLPAENNHNSSSLPTVGICGPALYFYNQDYSRRLIEWIEILLLLGVSKVILYEIESPESVKKVLDYYTSANKVERVHFRFPPPYLDESSLRDVWTMTQRKAIFALENIYFTDCVLRFKDEFDYLAHFDPDEIPISKYGTLPQLLHHLKKSHPNRKPAFYHLMWKTFYADIIPGKSIANIDKNFYFLSRNRYLKSPISPVDKNGKSIYDTSQVLAVFSHKALSYTDGKYLGINFEGKQSVVDPSIAYTGHFRNHNCGSRCDHAEFQEEDFLINLKDKIIENVNSVLKKLELDPEDKSIIGLGR